VSSATQQLTSGPLSDHNGIVFEESAAMLIPVAPFHRAVVPDQRSTRSAATSQFCFVARHPQQPELGLGQVNFRLARDHAAIWK